MYLTNVPCVTALHIYEYLLHAGQIKVEPAAHCVPGSVQIARSV